MLLFAAPAYTGLPDIGKLCAQTGKRVFSPLHNSVRFANFIGANPPYVTRLMDR